MKFATAVPFAFLAALTAIPASAADRLPTSEERAKIEAALKTEGFASWGDIELDDNRAWEVDDARHADGNQYDLDLHPQSLAIVKREPD